MKDKKITLEITLSYEDYAQIKEFVDDFNKEIELNKYLYKYGTVQDFIEGSVKKEIEGIKTHDEVFCELKTRGYIRPIKLKNNFKEIIKTMGLKQYHIQEMTGIGESDVSAIMNNRRLLSLDHFLRIWIALGCPDIDKVLYIEK